MIPEWKHAERMGHFKSQVRGAIAAMEKAREERRAEKRRADDAERRERDTAAELARWKTRALEAEAMLKSLGREPTKECQHG